MEDKLIKLAQKGDKQALQKLLQSNYSILKGYLIKLTKNETLADDLTQDTMIRAIEKIHKYKPTGKFSTWLITIATNLFRDKLRKDKRLVYNSNELHKGAVNDLEEQVVNRDEIEKVKSILDNIPKDKSMVFILKHYHGYSYKEIAEMMKCPVGTVRSRLHYCVKEIKLQMKGVEEDE